MSATTIKIEIPVSVSDKTDPQLSNITKKVTALGKDAEKTNKILTGGTGQKKSGIEKSIEKMDKVLGGSHAIEISVDDNATPVMSRIEDSASRISGMSSDISIGADDTATPEIAGVEDAASRLNGMASDVELGADDTATPIIDSVMDKASEFAGKTYTATIAINDATNGVTSGAANSGKSMIMAGAGMAGMSFGIVDAVDNFKTFEAQMSNVKAISGATEEEFSALTAKAKQMGADTKFSALESAQAFSYMAMAGWSSGQMIDGIAGIMNLAAASGEDLATTSDIVTDALTAFGLQAKDSNHFADVMAQTAANANTNVGMMGESFKYVAPLAGAMGYGIEDTALALGLMANAGIKSSMAGTSLKSSIANLASPTDKMATAMKKYGISLTDGEGNMKSLRGVMDNLRSSLGDLSETEQTAAATQIFGKEAMAGMLAIINASESDYESLTNAINNADGAADRMATTMMDNLGGSLEYLSGEWDETQNQLGQRLAPYIASGAKALERALPGARKKINSIFDGIDNRVGTMRMTQEWADASFWGKVDIAWNKLIADPFMDWAGGDGAHVISSGLGSLFSSAVKILPGGDDAGISSWLSAAVLGKGAMSAVSGISKLASTLSGFIPGAGTAVTAAAGVAGAIGAIGVAIDNYNQKQISTSLEEHFGSVQLTAEQAAEIASRILNAEWKVNIDLALGELRKADQLRKDAESKLAENDALEYKAACGVELTLEETETYITNVEAFLKNAKAELESRTFSAKLMVDTMLTTTEGQALSEKISQWTLEDNIEMTDLSSQLTRAVDEALSDGILDVDEERHINELQSSINSILSRWKEAEAQAQMDLLTQNYGGLSGKDLEAGAFTDVVSSLQEQRAANQEALDQASLDFYTMLHAMEGSGRLEEAGLDFGTMQKQWAQAIRNEQAKSLQSSIGFEMNTLNDTYGDLLSSNKTDNGAAAAKAIDFLNQSFSSGDDGDSLFNNLEAQLANMYSPSDLFSSGDQKALASLYETMKPDASAMGDLIDAYRAEGQAVPQAIMDSFNQAMEIGAASGDIDAAWQVYANQLKESGNQAMVEGIRNGTVAAPEELKGALERAFAETTADPISVDGVQAQLEDPQVTQESAQAVQDAVNNFTSALSETGSTAEVTANGVLVTLGDVEVDGQSAIESVASAVNMSADALAQSNGYESAVEVPMGAKITVPKDNITFDTSLLQASAKEEIDTAFEQEMETNGSANIEMSQTNNATEIYNEASGEVQSAFSSPIPVTATANITVDYNILNPSASITASSNGSAVTASIAGSADGRFVDGPMLSWIGEDGPEYVIPVGGKRRSRGIELWQQAGAALGVGTYADGGIVGKGMPPRADSEDDQETEPVNISPDIAPVQNGGVTVTIQLAPQFNMNDISENSVLQMIRTHMKDIADDLGNEIADMLSEAYENRPAV